jgi:hypothetical protein
MDKRKIALAKLLAPSRLKIERAKKHVNDLDDEIERFLALQPFNLIERVEKKPHRIVTIVREDIPIPPNLSLITGDAIHNLKSAFDMLAWTMVGDQAPTPETVLFPFAKTRGRLDGSIANRQMNLAGKDVVAAIKALEPHGGGNDLIYALHTLDITDKHRFIIPVGQVPEIPAEMFGDLMGIEAIGPGGIRPVLAKGVPIIAQAIVGSRAFRRSVKRPEKKHKVQPPFKICFGPEQPFHGQPIVEQLHLMVSAAEAGLTAVGEAFINSH